MQFIYQCIKLSQILKYFVTFMFLYERTKKLKGADNYLLSFTSFKCSIARCLFNNFRSRVDSYSKGALNRSFTVVIIIIPQVNESLRMGHMLPTPQVLSKLTAYFSQVLFIYYNFIFLLLILKL